MWGLNVTGVYAAKGSTVVLVDGALTNPNGLALFSGEDRLLVSETGGLDGFEDVGHPANYWAYDVARDLVTGR